MGVEQAAICNLTLLLLILSTLPLILFLWVLAELNLHVLHA